MSFRFRSSEFAIRRCRIWGFAIPFNDCGSHGNMFFSVANIVFFRKNKEETCFFRIANADTRGSRIQIRKNGVIDNLAVRRAKVYVGQAVHLVVVEGLLKVAEVVLSSG